jgi:hypothetical protein
VSGRAAARPRPGIFNISWDEVAKYIVATPEATKITADLMEHYPDRFLFGTDEAAPKTESDYMLVFETYRPLWNALSAESSQKVRKTTMSESSTKRDARSGNGRASTQPMRRLL